MTYDLSVPPSPPSSCSSLHSYYPCSLFHGTLAHGTAPVVVPVQCFVEHCHRQSYLYLEPKHAETDKVNLKNNEIMVTQLEIINCRFKTLLIIVSILLFLTLCFKVTSTHRKWVYFGIWVYLNMFRIDLYFLRVTSGLRPDELEPNEVVDQLPKFSFDGQRLQEDRLTQDEISLF